MVRGGPIRILRKLIEVQVVLIFSLVLFGRGLADFTSSLIENTSLEYAIGGVICIGIVTSALFGSKSEALTFVWVRICASIAILAVAISFLFSAEEALHLLLYGTLSITTLVLAKSEGRPKPWLYAFFFPLFVSVLDEALQGFHPQRVFDLRDLALNAVGAAIGLLAAPSSLHITR